MIGINVSVKMSLVFIITLQVYTVHSQSADAELLLEYSQLRAQHNAFDYNISIAHKLFASEDTMVEHGKVKLARNPADTILGGTISLQMDSLWYAYDGRNIMLGNFIKSELVLYDVQQFPNVFFLGSYIGDFIEKGFLYKTQGPIEVYNDPSIPKMMKDSVIDGVPARVFVFLLPDDEGEVYNKTLEVGIDPKTLHLLYRSYSAWFQENEQYTLWEFSNPRYHDDISIVELDSTFLNQFKAVSHYEAKSTAVEDTSEFQFDKLVGKVLNGADSVRLADSQAEFTIMDFWYTACYPCIKSIPAVNRIAEKYHGSKVKVFGVNPIDSEAKDMPRLLKFIKNNPMRYQTLMVDSKFKNALKLEGYPTFIILDKDLNVIYKEVGFSETLFEEVSAFLDARL